MRAIYGCTDIFLLREEKHMYSGMKVAIRLLRLLYDPSVSSIKSSATFMPQIPGSSALARDTVHRAHNTFPTVGSHFHRYSA